jgi:hypothetical protein
VSVLLSFLRDSVFWGIFFWEKFSGRDLVGFKQTSRVCFAVFGIPLAVLRLLWDRYNRSPVGYKNLGEEIRWRRKYRRKITQGRNEMRNPIEGSVPEMG